jgi:hypothetical protein
LLHVRAVSPAELTGRVVTELSEHSGVRNLVVLPGAAQRPDGDAVQFDLLNAGANPVLHQLRRLDLDSVGSVTGALRGHRDSAGLDHRGPRVHLGHHDPGGVYRALARIR